jgi:Kelch motif
MIAVGLQYWSELADRLTHNYGAAYDPKRSEELRPKLVRVLTRELADVDHECLVAALDTVLRQTKVTLYWDRFLCAVFSVLPGWWTKLTNDPGIAASTMLLLTDGTVMCQQQGGINWKKLTPDSQGFYVNGSWSDLAPMHWKRLYYASAVLQDGRVFVAGGEYSNAGSDTAKAEIYDPKIDTWTEIASPPGWGNVGDAPCAVLPDGRVLLGHIDSDWTAIYDPVVDTWTAGPIKPNISAEESWVLLPDDTVITVECTSSQRADQYDAVANAWGSGGTLPVNLVEISSEEIGPGVLLPDGRAFFAGATGHTALYKKAHIASSAGTWTAGPDFPNDSSGQTVGCKDAPACLLTNGRVLVAAGPVDGVEDDYLGPTMFHVFDGGSMTRIADPPNAAGAPYVGRMLLVPTGQVLFAAGTNEIYAYSYFSCPDASWRPQIRTAPSDVLAGFSFSVSGERFNGMSQAVGYGDDASAATNYPLVRIRHLASGRVRYCRTFGHSTMGVATGSATVSTNFRVPANIDQGPSELCVIANGIFSPSVPVGVESWRGPPDWELWASLIGSLSDGPLWVLGPHGPIPVDPRDPKIAVQASAATKQALEGLLTLQKLGGDLFAERRQAALEVEVAADEAKERKPT